MDSSLLDSWVKYAKLDKFSKENKETLATIFQNQVDYNQKLDDETYGFFKRVSVPILRRTFGNLIDFDLISIQSKDNSNQNPYMTSNDFICNFQWNEKEIKSLDDQAEFCADWSKKLFNSILNNCIINNYCREYKEYGLDLIGNLTKEVNLDKPDWIVVGSKIANIMTNNANLTCGHFSTEKHRNIPIYCLDDIVHGYVILGKKKGIVYQINTQLRPSQLLINVDTNVKTLTMYSSAKKMFTSKVRCLVPFI